MGEFRADILNKGFSHCWGNTPPVDAITTFNSRTFLQPQLNKACKSTEKRRTGTSIRKISLSLMAVTLPWTGPGRIIQERRSMWKIWHFLRLHSRRIMGFWERCSARCHRLDTISSGNDFLVEDLRCLTMLL